MSLLEELKRRNVFRVGIAYVVIAWLLLQVSDVVLNNIAAPGWVFKVILLLFFLAFVVMVYGVIPWEDLGLAIPTWWWWFPEMTANFLFFGILIGLIRKYRK